MEATNPTENDVMFDPRKSDDVRFPAPHMICRAPRAQGQPAIITKACGGHVHDLRPELTDFVDLSGLGRFQKRILRAFLANPDRLFRTVDLAEWCYPRLERSSASTAGRSAAAKPVAVRVRRDRPGGVAFRVKPEAPP